jgi:deoxyadenosine/deoxycytidine kinase
MKPDLFSPHTLADYTIIKSLLFAKMNLSNDEYKLFYKLYLSLTQHVKRPDIIIYLHRPIPVVQQHIMLRGREYEIHIKETYLEKIQQFYFDFFKNQTQIPVVIVDLQGKDFIADRKIFQEVQNIIYQPFSPGLHYKSIFNL